MVLADTVAAATRRAYRPSMSPPQPPPGSALPPHPVLNALLVCDLTIQDRTSGRMSLIEVLENIYHRKFPARQERLRVYFNVTDAQGTYRLRADLVYLDDLAVLGRYRMGITLADRTSSGESSFEADGLTFPRPGRYEIRLYANDRFLGVKAFNVVEGGDLAPP